MAKVSLRIYNREIERLIEQGSVDEAIAHCRHILVTFQKHLETYRLLGKAYLEARRYSEAVDIFGRLLMAVPDDFVSHVGLSIIRDEENKLDDAIWHMERAFEVQPSNAAIQGELQRLYGRRDGMEPPKVRMTRGALARIYVQGDLYPQAITEIRSVLAEDPQRADMQVLLALSYFKSGQKSDTVDLCNQLLKRYPYCLDANRIMVELQPAVTGIGENTQVSRMRVGEMDPYANMTRGSIFASDEVGDASINLERLDYTGQEVPVGQEWGSSLGISAAAVPALGSSSDIQPDWLTSGGISNAPASDEPKAEEEIPDFLRAAGWGEAQSPEKPTSFFDDDATDSGDLVPADLPDWLKEQAPTNSQPTEPMAIPTSTLDTPDWLNDLDDSNKIQASEAPTARMSTSDVPDWLSGLSNDDPAAVTSEPVEPVVSGDAPDWLSGLDSSESESRVKEEPAASGDVPDWLGGLASAGAVAVSASQSEPAPIGDAPDWLSGLGGSQPAEPADAEDLAQPADLPDWLKGAEPKSEPQPAASVESLGASSQEQDDAIAWLESLAAKHGAKPEELVTDPNKRSETPPEWVAQAQNIGQQPVAQTPENPADVQSLGASSQEQDDAIAWLESLAAKHGAKPEELVTDPNKRSETPPEWVQQAQTLGASEPVQEEPASVVSDLDSTGMWLRNLDEKVDTTPKAETPSVASEENMPEWLRPVAEEQKLERGEIPEWLSDPATTPRPEMPSASEPDISIPDSDLPNWLSGLDEKESGEPATVNAEQVMGNQDLSDWLSGLDNEPGLDLDPELLRAPEPGSMQSKAEEPAEPVRPNLPNWLNDLDSESEGEDDSWKQPVASTLTEEPDPVTETPVSLSADLPDWLQGVDEEEPAAPKADDDEDLPPWQHREQWEAEAVTAQPKPITPSDWHPIAEKTEAAQPQRSQLVENPPSPEPVAAVVAEKKKTPVKAQPQPKKAEGPTSSVGMLGQAKAELDRGDIPEALMHYGKLIKKGKHLEEIITHLNDTLYRYPVEVSIWQALGDAYMRANRLKEALSAYNKAEELIR